MGKPMKDTPKRIRMAMERFAEDRTRTKEEIKKAIDSEIPSARGFSLNHIECCMKLIILGYEPREMSFEELDAEMEKMPGGSLTDFERVAGLLKDKVATDASCAIRTMRKAERRAEDALKIGTKPLPKKVKEVLCSVVPDLAEMDIVNLSIDRKDNGTYYLKTKSLVEDEYPLN